MTGAMYAAIGGLKAHMSKLNVIGNNLANVNTYGYKSQRMSFKESMYTTSRSGSNGGAVTGGNNPSQVGYGCSVGSIDLNMSPSTYSPTGVALDCMIDGEGFFLVGDKTGAIRSNDQVSTLSLTRMGDFWMDPEGYICDRAGNVVYGFATVQNPDYNPSVLKPEEPTYAEGDDADAYEEKLAQYKINLALYEKYSAKTIISTELVPLRAPLAATAPTLSNGGLTAKKDADGNVIDPPTVDDTVSSKWLINEPVYPVLGSRTEEGYQSNVSPRLANPNYYQRPPVTDTPTEVPGSGDPNFTYQPAERLGEGATTVPVNAEGSHIQMKNMAVEQNGAITGTGPNGETVIIGYVAIAQVDSPDGVTHVDGPYYKAMGGAGNIHVNALGGVLEGKYLGNQEITEQVGDPGDPDYVAANTPAALDSIGNESSVKIRNSGLEASGTDVATEFAEMVTTQRGYQANTRIVTVTDSMLEELVNMKR